MKKTSKRFLAVLLTLCMLAALTASAFAEGKKYEKYVMIGDSISIYCGEVSDYSGTYSEKLSHDPELGIQSISRCAHAGWRIEEALFALGGPDRTTDVIMFWGGESVNRIKEYSPSYIKELSEADLITIQLGSNNIMELGVDALYKAFEQNGFDFNGNCMDRQIIENLNKLKEDYSDFEALVNLLSLLESTERGMVLLRSALKMLPTSIVNFQKYWDELMERIYKINPDADVVVIGVYNPVGMYLTKLISDNYDLDEKVKPLLDSTEQLLRHSTSILADAANLYFRSGSRYARQYVYVDVTDVNLVGTRDGSHLGDVGHQFFYERVKNAIVTHYLPESVPATKTTPAGLLGKLFSGFKNLF